MSVHDINLSYVSTWCPGCGNFGILNAFKQAMATLQLDLEQTALVTGIGCSSKIAQYVNLYRIETLHGRTLPVATGLKLANHNLNVVVAGGDGDGMGIGMGHFVHTARRNLNLAYFVHNNQIYALTKGQSSPTSEVGMITKFTPPPLGNCERPVNIVQLALSVGATFAARAFAGDIPRLVALMVEAIRHPGFAVVDILQPCVSFNHLNTYQWYRQRIQPVETMAGYDSTQLAQALKLANLWGDVIPVGLFYQDVRPSFSDSLPQLSQGTLISQTGGNRDIMPLMEELS